MKWLGWLHRRCERERATDRATHREWVKLNKAQWGEKNARIAREANERISVAAAAAKMRIAEVEKNVERKVRQRTEHALRAEAIATGAARAQEREEAYARGVADGRAEALREGPPVAALEEVARLLTPTSRDERCAKVRLNDREHAEAMVVHVLETAGVRTEPYPCPMCPRQLFGRGKFWHVRTIDSTAEKVKRDQVKRGQSQGHPDRLALRLPPEKIQELRGRASG